MRSTLLLLVAVPGFGFATEEKDPLRMAKTIEVTINAGTTIIYDKDGTPKVKKAPQFATPPANTWRYENISLDTGYRDSLTGSAIEIWRGQNKLPRGRAEVRAVYGSDFAKKSAVTFHTISEKGMWITTVFNKKDKDGRYIAVHSRHSVGGRNPQQYHGTAAITESLSEQEFESLEQTRNAENQKHQKQIRNAREVDNVEQFPSSPPITAAADILVARFEQASDFEKKEILEERVVETFKVEHGKAWRLLEGSEPIELKVIHDDKRHWVLSYAQGGFLTFYILDKTEKVAVKATAKWSRHGSFERFSGNTK